MIVVTTPTGQVGRQVAEGLIRTGEAVRVIARKADSLSRTIRDHAEVIEGTHADADLLATALDGAGGLFWLVPPDPRAADAFAHYRSFGTSAGQVLPAATITHVVGVSSLGRHDMHAGLLSAAFVNDELIERTGVAYRALSMPSYMDNLLSQAGMMREQSTFVMPNDPDRPLATVATRDIAATAVACLRESTWAGQATLTITGPDNLTPREMAVIISDVLGRDIRLQSTSRADFMAKMLDRGVSKAWAQAIVDMIAAQDRGIYDAERAQAKPSPTSFSEWCQDVLRPAVDECAGE